MPGNQPWSKQVARGGKPAFGVCSRAGPSPAAVLAGDFVNDSSPERSVPPGLSSFPPTPFGLPVGWLRAAGGLVLVSLIVQHGFHIGEVLDRGLHGLNFLLAAVFGADLVLAWRAVRRRSQVFGARRVEYWLLGGFIALVILTWVLPSAAAGRLASFLHLESRIELTCNLVKLFLLLSLCVQWLRATSRLFGKGTRPELILAGSFASVIVIGAFLLLLPNATVAGREPTGMVDALFTATSATCVTGLVVRDTGTDFSGFGQTIIFALFQVGGLGIITFVALLSFFSTRALPVPQMVIFRQLANAPTRSDLKRQIVGIVVAAGVIELAGAMLLFQFLPAEGDALARLQWSLFHAVSAFCNAGFALHADSLEGFQTNPGVNITIMGLIVLGGLGFLTISELVGFRLTRLPFFRRMNFSRRLHAGQVPGRLSVQTKLGLTVMLALLVVGAVGFWSLEGCHLLRENSVGESFLISAFQSVTPRTAGFNTVPIGQLQEATLVLLMMLMVVGANPVSAGGGIKTVSFGILLLALRAMVARRDRVEAFGRTIPAKTLVAALSVFVIYIISAVVGVFLLSLFDPHLAFESRVFEVISALSTVGLSMGITAELSMGSKLVLCVAMFVGRVGPLALVLSVFQSGRPLAYEFPEEEVVVG